MYNNFNGNLEKNQMMTPPIIGLTSSIVNDKLSNISLDDNSSGLFKIEDSKLKPIIEMPIETNNFIITGTNDEIDANENNAVNKRYLINKIDNLDNKYVTQDYIVTNYYDKTNVDNQINNINTTLTDNYYSKTDTDLKFENYYKKTTVDNKITAINNNLSNNYYNKDYIDTNYYNQTYVNEQINNINTAISNIPIKSFHYNTYEHPPTTTGSTGDNVLTNIPIFNKKDFNGDFRAIYTNFNSNMNENSEFNLVTVEFNIYAPDATNKHIMLDLICTLTTNRDKALNGNYNKPIMLGEIRSIYKGVNYARYRFTELVQYSQIIYLNFFLDNNYSSTSAPNFYLERTSLNYYLCSYY